MTPRTYTGLFAELANAGDLQGLAALYEDGAAFVGPNGTDAAGSDAIRDVWRGCCDGAAITPPAVAR